ncbi:glycosyltransferase family 2 protein [Niameybacter massiliensis]|uniref:glycosyltransferase family 2 protein n=1 Tax=Niameybacter massiliensis TaxID=1658108 RepID=UPI0006B4F940|nr:glycosyltransferase family 2 protein [Niameybacter massiliensis]
MDNKDFVMTELVSVITPAYNCAEYLEECIESVIQQTYSNWEMIIVNDKSTDSTKEIVEKYVAKDPRVKLYNQEVNAGAAAARNKAIELSKGRFIAFLDSDDKWKPHKLEKQIPFMLRNKYGFTFTSYEIMNGNKRNKKKIFRAPSKITYKQYLKNTIIGCLTVVMDKKILGEIKVEVGHLEDVLTWMKYLKRGYIAYGLDENLAEYRVVQNSVSSNKVKNAKRYYLCLKNEQQLSILNSIYCQICYMFNAIKKRIF